MTDLLRRRRPRRAAVTVGPAAGLGALVVAVGLLTGCGSSDSGAGPTPGDATFAAYRECLAQHGVVLPDRGSPPPGMPSGAARSAMPPAAGPSGLPTGPPPSGAAGMPSGIDASAWAAAQEACADLRPTGGPRSGPGAPDAGALQAYLACLKDHGVTASPGAAIPSTEPSASAALATCAPLRPTPGAPGAGGTGPAPTTTGSPAT